MTLDWSWLDKEALVFKAVVSSAEIDDVPGSEAFGELASRHDFLS
jgi:hypothetical protein